MSKVRIALDAGHGRNTPGKRTPDDEREWTFNDAVLRACMAQLQRYENVEVLRLDDATGATDIPLKTRTDRANAWGANVLVSIHHNALSGRWHGGGGVETYVQEKSVTKESRDIAALVHPRIVKAMGLRDRGVKSANFHMTRESHMPAILTEGGFMDSTTDIGALRSAAKLKAQGEAIAEGLAEYFGLKPKEVVTVAKVNEEYARDAKPSPTLAKDIARGIELGITDGSYLKRPATREEVIAMIVRAIDK